MAAAIRFWAVLTAMLAIIVAGLIAAVVVCSHFWVEPPTAHARLHVKTSLGSWRYSKNTEHTADRRLQSDKIRSRWILVAALGDPQVAGCRTLKEKSDPVDWLQNNLKVRYVADSSEVLVISLSGGQIDDLALIVNAIVDAYMAEAVEAPRAKRRQEIESALKLLEWTLRQLSETCPEGDKFPHKSHQELLHEFEIMIVELKAPTWIINKCILRALREAWPEGDVEFRNKLSCELKCEIERLKVELDVPPPITVIDRAVQPSMGLP